MMVELDDDGDGGTRKAKEGRERQARRQWRRSCEEQQVLLLLLLGPGQAVRLSDQCAHLSVGRWQEKLATIEGSNIKRIKRGRSYRDDRDGGCQSMSHFWPSLLSPSLLLLLLLCLLAFCEPGWPAPCNWIANVEIESSPPQPTARRRQALALGGCSSCAVSASASSVVT